MDEIKGLLAEIENLEEKLEKNEKPYTEKIQLLEMEIKSNKEAHEIIKRGFEEKIAVMMT